jgi:hypothetical protein
MSALTVFLIVVSALLVLAAVCVAVVAVWLGRHAVRAGRVVGRHARAGWSTARAALPSSAQEVRAERARLDRELAATSNAWQSGRRLLDRPARKRLGEQHEVLARIGRQVAYELTIAAADTDAGRRDAWLPDLRLRVDAFVVACGHFRQGVLLASGAYGNAVHVSSVAVGLAAAPVSSSEEPAVR